MSVMDCGFYKSRNGEKIEITQIVRADNGINIFCGHLINSEGADLAFVWNGRGFCCEPDRTLDIVSVWSDPEEKKDKIPSGLKAWLRRTQDSAAWSLVFLPEDKLPHAYPALMRRMPDLDRLVEWK